MWYSQSHHFGIETHEQTDGFSWNYTRNRTILELKRNVTDIASSAANPRNRTILELKLCMKQESIYLMMLAIAPFWNWNNTYPYRRGLLSDSQSHHFGIETFLIQGKEAAEHSRNRTILELKRGTKSWQSETLTLAIAPFWNWNNEPVLLTDILAALAIAPFWNWNLTSFAALVATFARNRTILELKRLYACFSRQCHFLAIAPFWNWNYTSLIASKPCLARNRTILELKPITEDQIMYISNLAIAPFWNWNS